LMEEIDLFMLGSFITESADILLPKDSPNEAMFNLIVETLGELNTGKSPLPAVLGFQLGALLHSGYAPSLDVCTDCGRPLGRNAHFCISKGGTVCADCAKGAQNGVIISSEFLRDRDLMEIHLGKVLKYIKLFSRFIEYHTEKKLNSAKFIEELKI
ncbi:MAG: DNA repair protein RecO, partial [Thermodesulfobacteriota bacterium]